MAIGLITTPASWANRTVVTPTWLQNVQDTINHLLSTAYCGDASDGNVTISAGTTTLTRDIYYNDLTITAGTLVTNGWCVYVKGTFTWSGGAITCNGAAGAAGAAGATQGGRTSAVGPHMGGPGAAGSQTATQPNIPASLLGLGGAGGGGGTSGGAGGLPGALLTNGTTDKRYKIPPFRGAYVAPSTYGISTSPTYSSVTNASFGGGSGGGGGRGDGTRQGGCGGEAGGLIFVIARTVVITGAPTASATGGAGGNGEASGNCGAGGGGGGGAGILLYGTLSGTPPTITVTGGSAGTPTGTGGGGGNGNAGASAFKTHQFGA